VRNVISILRITSSIETRLANHRSIDWTNTSDTLSINLVTIFEGVSAFVDLLQSPSVSTAASAGLQSNDVGTFGRAQAPENVTFALTQLLAFAVSYGLTGSEDRRRDVMESIQQTKSALESLCRDGKGSSALFKQALKEVRDLEYFVGNI
jgi:hypothetical protein